VPNLWLADGKERLLLSLHGVWQHERLLVEQPRPLRRQFLDGLFPKFGDLWNSLSC